MNTFSLVVIAALLLGAAVYAQQQIPRYTSRRNIILARGVLLAVAVGSGGVAALINASDALTQVLAFLIGFGAVHVPAAFILLIKRGSGSGRT